MSDSPVSLLDLESIQKAAEKESSSMIESDQIPCAKIIKSDNDVPKIDQVMPELSKLLDKNNIGQALDRLSSDPEELSRLVGNASFDPQRMEEARKLMMSGQGTHIIEEMRKRGLNPRAMRSDVLKERRSLNGRAGKTNQTKRCILMTANRQLKTRDVPIGSEQLTAQTIIKSGEPVELSCSRLALGPLLGKTIKVWCNPELKGTNRRLSKILGFQVAGEGLFIISDGDFNEKDFLEAEKLLV